MTDYSEMTVPYLISSDDSITPNGSPTDIQYRFQPLVHQIECLNPAKYGLRKDQQPTTNYIHFLAELMGSLISTKQIAGLRYPEFILFINKVLAKWKITKLVGIVALIYLERMGPESCIYPYGTKHRFFIGALLISNKMFGEQNVDFSSVKNACLIFSKTEIAEIEREFLILIGYKSWVTLAQMQEFVKKYQYELF